MRRRGRWAGARALVAAALATVALAAVALAGAGCQREAERPASGSLAGRALTFSVSLAEDEKDAVRATIARFEGMTGARVSLVSVTGDDLPEKLKVEVGAGRPTIDLFAKDTMALRVLVEANLVEDLSGVAIPDEVEPSMIPALVEGRRYFLPFRPNVRVTYANRARFAQAGVSPPTTLEELKTVARALRAAAGGLPKVTLPARRSTRSGRRWPTDSSGRTSSTGPTSPAR
jgi:ABC-type glycerol-3-phosphate transport system substrate-binding protein